jgi:alkylhydroperoxidase family enzyme
MASWILDRAAGDTEFARVFGLRENLYAHFGDFYARLWGEEVMDPVILELCRLRVAQLVGCDSELAVRSRPAVDRGLTEEAVAELRSWPTAPRFDASTRACLGFTEQFVIDPSVMGADDRAAVRGALGFPKMVGLAQAVAAFDGFCRFRLVLDIAADRVGTDTDIGTVTTVDVGVADASVPAVASGDGDADDRARGFAAAQPDLFASFERLYAVLWSGGVVDHPSKEVARLRNARVTGCRFCRNVRFARARRDGLTETLVDLVADGYETTALVDAHKAVLALTDAFLGDARAGLDDGLRQELLAHYGSAGTVELTAGLALFMGFSKIAVALGAFPDDFPTTVIPTPGDGPGAS